MSTLIDFQTSALLAALSECVLRFDCAFMLLYGFLIHLCFVLLRRRESPSEIVTSPCSSLSHSRKSSSRQCPLPACTLLTSQIVSGTSAHKILNRLVGQPFVTPCSCTRDLVVYLFRIPRVVSAMRPRGFHGTPTNMRRVSGFQCRSAAIRLNDRVVSLHFVVPTISSERSSEKKTKNTPSPSHLGAMWVWIRSGVQ